MLMQNFGLANKEHYGMLWYFLEWSIGNIKSTINTKFTQDIWILNSTMTLMIYSSISLHYKVGVLLLTEQPGSTSPYSSRTAVCFHLKSIKRQFSDTVFERGPKVIFVLVKTRNSNNLHTCNKDSKFSSVFLRP